MLESPVYRQIMDEGKALGLDEGKALGLKEGLERGRREGMELGREKGMELGEEARLREDILEVLVGDLYDEWDPDLRQVLPQEEGESR